MAIDIPPTLQQWLHECGLAGYTSVVEALPHPNTQDIGVKINVDTITNATIRKKLGLSPLVDRCFGIPLTTVLEKYFREYSTSAKAYKIQKALDIFFCDVIKFLLEVACMHPQRLPTHHHLSRQILAKIFSLVDSVQLSGMMRRTTSPPKTIANPTPPV